MPLPEIPTQDSGTPNPIEALSAPIGEARGAAIASGFESTLGISLETQAIGKLSGGTQFIPYNDAKSIMEKNGYDAHVLPAGGLSNSELNAIMNQQSAIKRNDAIVQQSSLSKFTGGALRMVGGAGDPIFIAAGPILGRLGFAVKGMGIGGRVAAGTVEGATVNAGYDVALKHFGTAPGDADIGTEQIVQDALVGGLVGGVLHGRFGPRAPVPQGVNYLSMIDIAENTAAYAKAHGISENDVVSSAGAVGKYQVTPGTAKQYGFDPARLTDPAYNREAATAILDDLHKRFGNDPEAIAVGYNAGPGRARQFVQSGHDRSMLPKETRDYLARIDRAGGREQFGLAQPGARVTPNASEATIGVTQDGEAGVSRGVQDQVPGDVSDVQNAEARARQSALSAVPRGEYEGVAGGSEEVTAAYSHAYAAAAADAVPDISSEYRTNPFRIADEHAAEVTRLETEAMQRAFGRPTVTPGTIEPGSVFTHDPAAKAILSQPPPESVGRPQAAEFADLAQSAADAVHEAEQAHALTGGAKLEEGPQFKTAKGSTYQVHEDGTTTRNKAARPDIGHEGQSGPQPRSQATFYVSAEDADKLSLFQTQGGKKAIAKTADGKWGVKYLEGKDAGKFERRTVISPQAEPGVGLTPVEVFSDGKSVHFGNEITEVTPKAEPAETLQAELAAAEDAAHAEGYSPDMVKAIHAAVRCGLVKGLG